MGASRARTVTRALRDGEKRATEWRRAVVTHWTLRADRVSDRMSNFEQVGPSNRVACLTNVTDSPGGQR